MSIFANPALVPTECLFKLVGCEKSAQHVTPAILRRAAARVEPEPTSPQILAGNYRKGHIRYRGLPITIETAAGEFRHGVDKDGKRWKKKLTANYGYIKKTKSEADGDHVDVFIGPHLESELVFVVNQVCPKSGKFDEHKVILGALSADSAKKLYLSNYSENWKGFDSIVAMTLPQFKNWLAKGNTGNPVDSRAIRKVANYYDVAELNSLTAAPPVRSIMQQAGIIGTPTSRFAPHMSLFDAAKLQAGRQNHWDSVAEAAKADQGVYQTLLKNMALLSGARPGARFNELSDKASDLMTRIAPYAMTQTPRLWDQLHGNRGSAASLASAIASVHPERTAVENAAAAQKIHRQLPADAGLSSADLGEVYRAMHQKGLIHRGGLEAVDQTSNLFHTGSAIRGLVDFGQSLQKRAYWGWPWFYYHPTVNAFNQAFNYHPYQPYTTGGYPENAPHRAVSEQGEWRGEREYSPEQSNQLFQSFNPVAIPATHRDPPKKPELLLRWQNPLLSAAARRQVRSDLASTMRTQGIADLAPGVQSFQEAAADQTGLPRNN